jgi:multisubunit Na+/H+ antiporter MnhB subunit
VAITQVVVEVLGLIILIRATISRDLTTVSGSRAPFGLVVTVVLILTFALAGGQILAQFPEFGSPVMERVADAPSVTYLREGQTRTGAANIVTAILLDFRAYDTLGEATVLLCAVVGAISILRRKARKSIEQCDEE